MNYLSVYITWCRKFEQWRIIMSYNSDRVISKMKLTSDVLLKMMTGIFTNTILIGVNEW